MVAVFRLEGLSRVLREAFPAAGEPLYEAVTWLGDPALLTIGLAIGYWLAADRRRATALVVAYGFVAFGAVVALKTGFALPRPPESIWLIATDGFGFPSGHAIGATVVYGGLALEYGWRDHGGRLAAAGAIVAAVALSRVVLGVHYLGDVLAGVAVGLGVLLVARPVVAGRVDRGFGLGLVASVPALAVTGGGETALRIAGSCLGGLVAALGFERVPTATTPMGVAGLVAVGVPLVVATLLAEPLVEPIPLGSALNDAVLVAVVLLLPAAVARVV